MLIEEFFMMHNTNHKIEDYPIGSLVEDWGAGCNGRLAFVVGYPKEGGYSKEILNNFPYGIHHDNHNPCVITVTNDGLFHVRSIYCQKVIQCPK